jgi:hypothetical protein
MNKDRKKGTWRQGQNTAEVAKEDRPSPVPSTHDVATFKEQKSCLCADGSDTQSSKTSQFFLTEAELTSHSRLSHIDDKQTLTLPDFGRGKERFSMKRSPGFHPGLGLEGALLRKKSEVYFETLYRGVLPHRRDLTGFTRNPLPKLKRRSSKPSLAAQVTKVLSNSPHYRLPKSLRGALDHELTRKRITHQLSAYACSRLS